MVDGVKVAFEGIDVLGQRRQSSLSCQTPSTFSSVGGVEESENNGGIKPGSAESVGVEGGSDEPAVGVPEGLESIGDRSGLGGIETLFSRGSVDLV